jgi:hypothetical protein
MWKCRLSDAPPTASGGTSGTTWIE